MHKIPIYFFFDIEKKKCYVMLVFFMHDKCEKFNIHTVSQDEIFSAVVVFLYLLIIRDIKCYLFIYFDFVLRIKQ